MPTQLSGGSARILVGDAREPMKVLVIDIGGTSAKLLVSGQHRAVDVPLRTEDDAGQDGPKDPRNGRRLGLFGGLDWLSRARPTRAVE